MQNEEIKDLISKTTGIPVNLIPGETPEEYIAGAKALLAYKEKSAQGPKTGREQLEAWISSQVEEKPQESPLTALNDIENKLKPYPSISDGGEVANMPDPRSPREQFKEWFNQQTQYNPFRTPGNF